MPFRESYREEKKVKHKTIANLSHCTQPEIEAIRLALKHKGDLSKLSSISEELELIQGPSFGAVWVLSQIAKELGIDKALGNTRDGKLALWQVFARIIDQGSRLSAVRLASRHVACDVLGVATFNEDDLYSNLNWTCSQQEKIENRLFSQIAKKEAVELYLYDVTSSYFEGKNNELAAFGYNRDRKNGKLQIVIGLVCNQYGVPLSIEVFRGNTSDINTFGSQIKKVKERFGAKEVTFVGDRGMIKGPQIKELHESEMHYITAITKPQIEKLIKEDQIQLGLFDTKLAEVTTDESIRYILRRNPIRTQEIRASRDSKLACLKLFLEKLNKYLKEHPRAKESSALNKVIQKSKKLKIESWLSFESKDRVISLTIREQAKKDLESLDGCYVLKTDLSEAQASKEIIHDRYKQLALVETSLFQEVCK